MTTETRFVTAEGLLELPQGQYRYELVDTVKAPDVAFVSAERVQGVTTKTGFFPGPPDLAVEIVSPNDRHGEVEEKVEL